MNKPKIVLLAGEGFSTRVLFHALNKIYPFALIILEKPVGKKEFLQRRIKKLGIGKVLAQIFFQLIIVRILDFSSAARKLEIMGQYAMDDSLLPPEIINHVNSVNEDRCIRLLQETSPDLVIVNGTRIISKQVLKCITAPFVNIHAGITPTYRGVHGAYWALANRDKAHCGVTVHYVDAGIDTGGVIAQQPIPISPKDNFVTYPLLQLGAGIGMLTAVLPGLSDHKVQDTGIVKDNTRLWYHPGIFQYLYFRLTRGVK